MSVAVVICSPCNCSGAAYSGVRALPPIVNAATAIRNVFTFDQLGDAEVEQLHMAVVAYEDVRRLEIAVHNQLE